MLFIIVYKCILIFHKGTRQGSQSEVYEKQNPLRGIFTALIVILHT